MSALAVIGGLYAASTLMNMYAGPEQNASQVRAMKAQAGAYRASAAENLAFAREQASLYMRTGAENDQSD